MRYNNKIVNVFVTRDCISKKKLAKGLRLVSHNIPTFYGRDRQEKRVVEKPVEGAKHSPRHMCYIYLTFYLRRHSSRSSRLFASPLYRIGGDK